MSAHDELFDRLEDLYQAYYYKMSFDAFLKMVINRMEARYGGGEPGFRPGEPVLRDEGRTEEIEEKAVRRTA
jgi:hypothetical protein